MNVFVDHYFLNILYGTNKLNIGGYPFYLSFLPRAWFKKLFLYLLSYLKILHLYLIPGLACRNMFKGEMMGSSVGFGEEQGL